MLVVKCESMVVSKPYLLNSQLNVRVSRLFSVNTYRIIIGVIFIIFIIVGRWFSSNRIVVNTFVVQKMLCGRFVCWWVKTKCRFSVSMLSMNSCNISFLVILLQKDVSRFCYQVVCWFSSMNFLGRKGMKVKDRFIINVSSTVLDIIVGCYQVFSFVFIDLLLTNVVDNGVRRLSFVVVVNLVMMNIISVIVCWLEVSSSRILMFISVFFVVCASVFFFSVVRQGRIQKKLKKLLVYRIRVCFQKVLCMFMKRILFWVCFVYIWFFLWVW